MSDQILQLLDEQTAKTESLIERLGQRLEQTKQLRQAEIEKRRLGQTITDLESRLAQIDAELAELRPVVEGGLDLQAAEGQFEAALRSIMGGARAHEPKTVSSPPPEPPLIAETEAGPPPAGDDPLAGLEAEDDPLFGPPSSGDDPLADLEAEDDPLFGPDDPLAGEEDEFDPPPKSGASIMRVLGEFGDDEPDDWAFDDDRSGGLFSEAEELGDDGPAGDWWTEEETAAPPAPPPAANDDPAGLFVEPPLTPDEMESEPETAGEPEKKKKGLLGRFFG